MKEAGGFRFHDLRDFYGTMLADQGLPPHKVAKVMGHEKSTTTMQFYIRHRDDFDAIRGALGDEGEGTGFGEVAG